MLPKAGGLEFVLYLQVLSDRRGKEREKGRRSRKEIMKINCESQLPASLRETGERNGK